MRNNLVLILVFSVMASMTWTGCESAGGKEGIEISPGVVTLSLGGGTESTTWPSTDGSTAVTNGSTNNNANVVVFTAHVESELRLPLKWSVSNPGLGRILNSSGTKATYVRTSGNGDNLVTVKDQAGNEGTALVTQK